MKRVALLALTIACAAKGPRPHRDALADVVFARVVDEARSLASHEFDRGDSDPMPETLASLDYQGYVGIQFRAAKNIRLGDGFAVQLFHRGGIYDRRVDIFVQPRDGEARKVAYDASLFDLGPALAGQSFPADLGFAGLRVYHGTPKVSPEFLVMQGASYFRLVGDGQSYGASARGVAVDTGLPHPEEFPEFFAFWLIEPEVGSKQLPIVALLDGPSVTGAVRFVLEPGKTTVVDVEATIFVRKPVERLGLAPLTSMFWHGSNGPADHSDDYRPQTHDSDGLLLRTKDEVGAYRPLVNGRDAPRTSSFRVKDLHAFGLMQRERNFAVYQDVESRQEARPGLLIELAKPWSGAVHLYEIPTRNEYLDNIVAYLQPDPLPRQGERIDIAYRIRTVGDDERAPIARVVGTHIGPVDRLRPPDVPQPTWRIYVVDWRGDSLPRDPKVSVSAVVSASSGAVVDPVVQYVPQTGGWRVWFEHRPDGDKPLEFRAYLESGGRQVTETWLYGP
ncbi:MAG: glucan biosynthesis protein [Myxococcota bacterium]